MQLSQLNLNSYYQYQNVNQRHYLIQINLLAQLLFLVHFFLDWLLIPDVSLQSGIGRVALALTFMLINWLSFKHITNVLIHDLLLPVSSTCRWAMVLVAKPIEQPQCSILSIRRTYFCLTAVLQFMSDSAPLF